MSAFTVNNVRMKRGSTDCASERLDALQGTSANELSFASNMWQTSSFLNSFYTHAFHKGQVLLAFDVLSP
jgi:hypothetical protein